MSPEWTAEELIANLKRFKRSLIQNNGFIYVEKWDFELIDDLITYLGKQDVLPAGPES